MARPEKFALKVPAAVGVGAPSVVFRFRSKTVQVFGTFVATLQLEGTLAGDEYFPIGPAVTAPGAIEVPETIEFLRVRVTAFTSGEPKAVFAGFDERAW
ncbi:MAG: hypothetical protein HY901_36955 [Deltaproteobacteria bacterium]|nr:hypothetical protein [Deltaproteobacteria bacterium]